MKELSPKDKYKAWTAGTKSIKFINQLKRHVRIEAGFTGHRAAHALLLLEEYINGEFLMKVQEFKLDE